MDTIKTTVLARTHHAAPKFTQADKDCGMSTSMGNPRGRGIIDQATRDRIRRWIEYEMKKRQIDSIREMARRVGVSHAYLSLIVNGQSTAGLELVIRLNRKLHVSIDAMVNDEPPKSS